MAQISAIFTNIKTQIKNEMPKPEAGAEVILPEGSFITVGGHSRSAGRGEAAQKEKRGQNLARSARGLRNDLL